VFLGLAALGMVATACSSSSSKSSGGSGATGSGSSTTIAAKQGGDLVVSAEQEPDCVDWVASCAASSWGVWSMFVETMPRAYDITDKTQFVPGDMLAGPADFVATPTEKITYHIKPEAVWSDGQPITSHDFKYTWDQEVHGKDINDTTGYIDIASVDDTDPHTAVVTMAKPFVDWKALFSGFVGVLPSHLLEGKDRSALMKDGYTFSGGPWMIDHWTKGTEVKLVPNPKFWGKKPNLNSLTFKFLTDTAAEQAAFKSGQVSAVYPQAQPGGETLKDVPGTDFSAVPSLFFEEIWFQDTAPVVKETAVRQALAYATDRDAIVKQLFSAIQPDIAPIQSSYTPAHGPAYSTPYSKYKPDLKQVDTLMTGAGWAKGGDGIWAKGGQRASLELKTTTGNKRRALTAQILQSQWKAAGFELNLVTEKAGVLFGKDLPGGNFQVALYAQTPSDPDPAQCNIWCSKNIPGPSNANAGQDYTRYSDPTVDKLEADADTNFDQATRLKDVNDAQKTMADAVPALPLDPFPDIVAINGDRVGSETGKFVHNVVYGPFDYANTWFLK